MDHEGDESVLSRLARGEGRIGLLVLSGGMRGVYGGGQLAAMEKYNLRNRYVVNLGISSGAPGVGYSAGGVAWRGHRIYYEECTTPAYMSGSIRRMIQGTTIDLDYLCSVFRGDVGSNPIDIEAMRACKADVYVGVTDYETGEGVLIDVKTATPDPVAAIHASIAMPHVYRKPVVVNGRRYLDGTGGMPFPAREMVERWNLDGLVVLANGPRIRRRSLKRDVLEFCTINLLPPGPRRTSRRRLEVFAENLAYLREGKTPYLIVSTDDEVKMFDRNPVVLKAAAERGYSHMTELFTRAGVM